MIAQLFAILNAQSSPATVLATIRAGNVTTTLLMPRWRFIELASDSAKYKHVERIAGEPAEAPAAMEARF
jgi:hypothetical protein